MSTVASRLVVMDWASFNPWRMQGFTHRLSDHPLVRRDSVESLSARLEAEKRVLGFGEGVHAGTGINRAVNEFRHRRAAAETVRGIEHARAWLSLRHIQSDPLYRTLVDDVLDDVRPFVERVDPGMCWRAGWVFVSSPGQITPFHIDTEHNFLLQMLGHKRVHVWDHRDTVAVSDHARDHFLNHGGLDGLVWHDDLRARARVFELGPGDGAYMPSTSPHMVENGDRPSITMSFTYYTRATRRRALLHRLRDRCAMRGLDLPPVGSHPAIEAVASRALSGLRTVKGGVRRLLRMPTGREDVAYAIARTYGYD
jgi:hypothetical protein